MRDDAWDEVLRSEASRSAPCPSCDDWIQEGDDVYLIDDQWVCATCAEAD